jgi:hypothetical protein
MCLFALLVGSATLSKNAAAADPDTTPPPPPGAIVPPPPPPGTPPAPPSAARFSNQAQAAHAQNLANSYAATRDPAVAAAQRNVDTAEQALEAAKLSGDPAAIDAAQRTLAANQTALSSAWSQSTSATTQQISQMRAIGIGWGEIAHRLDLHPGTLGLGKQPPTAPAAPAPGTPPPPPPGVAPKPAPVPAAPATSASYFSNPAQAAQAENAAYQNVRAAPAGGTGPSAVSPDQARNRIGTAAAVRDQTRQQDGAAAKHATAKQSSASIATARNLRTGWHQEIDNPQVSPAANAAGARTKSSARSGGPHALDGDEARVSDISASGAGLSSKMDSKANANDSGSVDRGGKGAQADDGGRGNDKGGENGRGNDKGGENGGGNDKGGENGGGNDKGGGHGGGNDKGGENGGGNDKGGENGGGKGKD